MSILRSLALPLTATAAGGAFGLGHALYRVAKPSAGAPIASSASKTAVVIIDMQAGFTSTQAPPDFAERVVPPALHQINELTLLARRRGWPVLAVRMTVKNPRLRLAMRAVGAPMPKAGSPDAQLDSRLDLAAAEVFWALASGLLFWPQVLSGPLSPPARQAALQDVVQTFLARYAQPA